MQLSFNRFLPLAVLAVSLTQYACGGGDEEFIREWNATQDSGECVPLDQLKNREEAEKYPVCK